MQRYLATNKKKKSLKTKLRIIGFLILCLVFLFVFYYFSVVCPVVEKLSEEKIRAVATKSVSRVVGEVMTEKHISYSDLVSIEYSGSGEVEVVELNSVNLNILVREITQRVQEEFDSLKNEKIYIALGTFTGIPFLYNLGPNIPLGLVPVGTVSTKINSNFQSAGINQTLHRVDFIVSGSFGMVLPSRSQNFDTNLEVLICESVIVGKIPQIYLNK